jgi:5'(3')-deoxyribonucleotidase
VIIKHILLDMDGVIADLQRAICELLNKPEALDTWPLGQWEIETGLGLPAIDIWDRIEDAGESLWTDRIQPYPWTRELIALVNETAPYTIATIPTQDPCCASGKLRWLYQHVRLGMRNHAFVPDKALMAKPTVVLIDDSDFNVRRFRGCGGWAILFPQRWNANHHLCCIDRVEYVRREIDRIRHEISLRQESPIEVTT